MQQTVRSPRGMRDVLPEEAPLWRALEETARRLARLRGFREIRPTLLEETDLFVRSVGEVTDIVEKEMFTLQKGKTSLSLRPEGTAGIVRAYLQAGYPKTQPVQRLFHTGPMFRYERPQKGRERMFTQFDVEALGSTDPRLDAEVIALAVAFFRALGFRSGGDDGLVVHLSSMGDGADRDRFREVLRDFVRPVLSEFCELCQSRFERNVLRMLDCKNPACREALERQSLRREPEPSVPSMLDEGMLAPENREHFEMVEACLAGLGIRYVRDPGLVRGLDYYTRTVFEVHYPALGARSAVCGGGRYDHLIEELGGPDLGAVGFAVGFSPTLIALRELGLEPALEPDAAAAYVVAAGDGLGREVFLLAEELRAAGVGAVYDTEGRSVKAQMKAANKGGHRFALVLGPDELARGSVQVKDLRASEQEEVPRAELVERLRAVTSDA